jgi:hypothetical protein
VCVSVCQQTSAYVSCCCCCFACPAPVHSADCLVYAYHTHKQTGTQAQTQMQTQTHVQMNTHLRSLVCAQRECARRCARQRYIALVSQ